MAASVIR